MEYAEARAAFFQPRTDGEPPGSVAWKSPARALRDAIEPIATIGFWSESAHQRYAEYGLDFLKGYVWARSSVLGEANSSVAAAAFGVFEPQLVTDLHAAARAQCSAAQMRRATEEASVAELERILGAPPGLDSASLDSAVRALAGGLAAADTTGRALAAGLAGLEWPGSALGALWHACALLREYRGDGHLAACVAAGLTGLEANILTELRIGWEPTSYTATRGWSPEQMAAATERLAARGLVTGSEPGGGDSGGGDPGGSELTGEGRALRDGIEETTDRLMQPVVDALGPELVELTGTLDEWSQRIIDAGSPPPPRPKWSLT